MWNRAQRTTEVGNALATSSRKANNNTFSLKYNKNHKGWQLLALVQKLNNIPIAQVLSLKSF
jgi:hypothetical protein